MVWVKEISTCGNVLKILLCALHFLDGVCNQLLATTAYLAMQITATIYF